MKISYIACEYNPFHNGHLYHIEKTKECFSDAVVCIMSGNFVQRGEAAVCEKHIRAELAVKAGADLVIELPVKYATSTAPKFAEGFVKTAQLTGLDGAFSFGSANSVDTLRSINKLMYSDEAEKFASSVEVKNKSYPAAKADFLKNSIGEYVEEILKDANNILAMEYIRAIDSFCPEAEINSVTRIGVAHDSDITTDEFASASFIRNTIYEAYSEFGEIRGLYSVKKYIPDFLFNSLLEAHSEGAFPLDKERFSHMIISRIVSHDAEFFRSINSVNGGLENKIVNSLKTSSSLDEIYSKIKSKRYTHSRIRQIILQSALGITRADIESGVSYIRVLGFNDTGREILHKMKKTAMVPVVMNLSEVDKNDSRASRDAFIDYLAGKLFNQCLPCPLNGNPEYDIPPVYVK